MKTIFLILILLFSSTLLASPKIDPDIQIKINGLVCTSCAIGVKKFLKKKTEIKQMSMDTKNQSIFVEYWNVELHPTIITKIIKNAGYEVTSITWLKKKLEPNRYNAP